MCSAETIIDQGVRQYVKHFLRVRGRSVITWNDAIIITKKATSGSSRVRQYKAIAYEKQDGLCFYCYTPLNIMDNDDPEYLTAEHVVCKKDGGKDYVGNIVAACYNCNTARGSKDVLQFFFRKRMELGKPC